jgi:hypothetical protein
VIEENWFFRLSRYQEQLRELITEAGCGSSPRRAATRCWR